MVNCRQCDWQVHGFCGFWWKDVKAVGFCDNGILREDIVDTVQKKKEPVEGIVITKEEFLKVAHNTTCGSRECKRCILNKKPDPNCADIAIQVIEDIADREGIDIG